MICMVFVSKILLKYKYYKHHLVSIIIFIIFGIICDIILSTYEKLDWTFFLIKLIRIFAVTLDAIYYCYQKYMMEVLFYPYWNNVFFSNCSFNYCTNKS